MCIPRKSIGLMVGLVPLLLAVASAQTPISPSEAAKKIDEKVILEMEVKSSGGNTNCYLNSESDYKDEKNFTVFIPKEALAKFKDAKIDNPATYFKGKIVQVTGTVTLSREKPQIKVNEPSQIKVVKKQKSTSRTLTRTTSSRWFPRT